MSQLILTPSVLGKSRHRYRKTGKNKPLLMVGTRKHPQLGTACLPISGEDLCLHSLVYTASSSAARTTERHSVSKERRKENGKEGKEGKHLHKG